MGEPGALGLQAVVASRGLGRPLAPFWGGRGSRCPPAGCGKGWLCREVLLTLQGLKDLLSSPVEGTAKRSPYSQPPLPRQGRQATPQP